MSSEDRYVYLTGRQGAWYIDKAKVIAERKNGAVCVPIHGWLDGRGFPKHHPTWEAAHDHLIAREADRIKKLRSDIEKVKKALDKLSKMAKPTVGGEA